MIALLTAAAYALAHVIASGPPPEPGLPQGSAPAPEALSPVARGSGPGVATQADTAAAAAAGGARWVAGWRCGICKAAVALIYFSDGLCANSNTIRQRLKVAELR